MLHVSGARTRGVRRRLAQPVGSGLSPAASLFHTYNNLQRQTKETTMRYASHVEALIGNTPLVDLSALVGRSNAL